MSEQKGVLKGSNACDGVRGEAGEMQLRALLITSGG